MQNWYASVKVLLLASILTLFLKQQGAMSAGLHDELPPLTMFHLPWPVASEELSVLSTSTP